MMTSRGIEARPLRLWKVWLRYLALILVGNLVWEFAHMPLYTIWYEGTWSEIIYAGLHCTAGDVLIAGFALMISISVFGRGGLSSRRSVVSVAITAISLGLAYTIFSEYLNITIRKSWAYSDLMPIIPVIDAGLSPLMQWIIIPGAGFWVMARSMRHQHGRARPQASG